MYPLIKNPQCWSISVCVSCLPVKLNFLFTSINNLPGELTQKTGFNDFFLKITFK